MKYGRCTLLFEGDRGIADVRALIPQTKEARLQGLRSCRFLPLGSGMLFQFSSWESPALTMTGMKIPLDIVHFTRRPHSVLKVIRAHPGQKRIQGPRGTWAALEVPAGWSVAYGVRPGTAVRLLS